MRPTLVLLFLTMFGIISFAQDKAQEQQMSHDDMMKMYMEMAAPGEEHEFLGKFVGEWDVIVDFASPSGAMETSKATASCEMILGGRFLQVKSTGTVSGMPFEGLSFMGFDKRFKTFTMDGYDTMGTYGVHATGTRNGNEMDFKGTNFEVTIQKEVPYRFHYILTDDDNYEVDLFFEFAPGYETKLMHMAYTRKK